MVYYQDSERTGESKHLSPVARFVAYAGGCIVRG